eukprot:gene7812-10610_t
MNLWGKKKEKAAAPNPPQAVETINMLKQNLSLLEKREEHLAKKVETALAEAKQKSLKKDKNGALFALKRKKMLEAEITKLQGTRITLDSQILSLENASINIETFKAFKAGNNEMRRIRGDLDADKIEDIMDEIEEEKDIQDTISSAMARPMNDILEDDDLLAELAELEALDAEDQLLQQTKLPQQSPSIFNMPAVPSNTVQQLNSASNNAAVEESEDERVLRQLQAEMFA